MLLFTYEQLDELGEGLVCQYMGRKADTATCVNIDGFVTDFLQLPIKYYCFDGPDADKLGFISDGLTPLHIREDGVGIQRVFPKGTIVVEKGLLGKGQNGRRRFTVSHEGAHFIRDRTVAQASFRREYDGEHRYSPKDFKQLLSFRETQIDRMGAALLMPRFMVLNLAQKSGVTNGIPIYGDSILRPTDKLLIQQMARSMHVSTTAFLIRLRELKLLRQYDISAYITGEMGLGAGGAP